MATISAWLRKTCKNVSEYFRFAGAKPGILTNSATQRTVLKPLLVGDFVGRLRTPNATSKNAEISPLQWQGDITFRMIIRVQLRLSADYETFFVPFVPSW
jgi:hypothetical protein